MSRSYKKFPIHKDREKPKTYANRAVRRSNGIPEGKAGYKKLYCSWIICDYHFYDCRNETEFKVLWKRGILRWYGDTYAEALSDWKKYNIRK